MQSEKGDRQTDRQTEVGWGGGVLASFKCKGSYWLLNQMLVLKGVDAKRMQEASPGCIAGVPGVPALQGTRNLEESLVLNGDPCLRSVFIE